MEIDAVAEPGAELVEFGRGLARAASIDDVIQVLADVAGPLVGAANATALVLDESRSKLVVYHGPAARTQAVRVVDLSDPTPAAHVVRTGEPVFLASLDELCEAYPALRRAGRADRLGRPRRAPVAGAQRAVRGGRVPLDGRGRVHAGATRASSRRSRSSSATPSPGPAATTTSSPTRAACANPTATSTASPPPSPTTCGSRCAS